MSNQIYSFWHGNKRNIVLKKRSDLENRGINEQIQKIAKNCGKTVFLNKKHAHNDDMGTEENKRMEKVYSV